MTRLVRNPHSGNLIPEAEALRLGLLASPSQPAYLGLSPLGAAFTHLGLSRSLGWSEEIGEGDLIRLTRLGLDDLYAALRSLAQRAELRDALAATAATGPQVLAVLAGLALAQHYTGDRHE
ncbi:hypothetical protein [Deinococcus phoenicis]|uniref:hypothetical protein n=1 Tax=Deinococcus phoenicis TaxID=1476583 RepID=UPI000551D780|nr:hypothetical protein [Deinococcus phoenicis]